MMYEDMNENHKNIDKTEASLKTPLSVEAPANTAEAADLFKRFNDLKKSGQDIRVCIQDSPFCPADQKGCSLLSSGNMNKISEVSRKDMLAVCGGGVTLAELRGAVESEGLFFPYDPELAPTDLTIGALVMDGGVSRYERSYGRLRESILSIEIVTPAGEIIHTGSRSIKDVAGYELAGLFAGGGGQYGLISSVTLRLLPVASAISGIVVTGERSRLEGIESGMYNFLSFDLRGPLALPGPPAFGWSSVMPHRNIVIWPESSGPDPEKDRSDENRIFRYVKDNFSPGARFRAGYIKISGEGVVIRRVRPNDRAGGLAGLSAELEEGPAVSEISGRIRKLFDPEGIIDDGFADD
ncbi:MAG: FAD-binding oxidoreductase [Candidatus Krumholzibacteria bacterium]|nr:FAD-binding oxidoreductase [Candidatus Krumholzibacteria bacterium]